VVTDESNAVQIAEDWNKAYAPRSAG